MDAATKSLDHILKSGEYSVVKDIPVFDEHDEFDAEGKLIRKFDRKALQKIVDECNRRAKNTGDLSPFGPGHTVSNAPEHLQPVTYGYVADYRVGEYGPKKRLGILADFYVKNKVRTPDGKDADGIEEFKSYPRRSIELWTKDGFIDHIALLRRTPMRDLGLMAFNKGQTIAIPSTGQLFSYSKKDFSAAVVATTGGLKLCYAMEPEMDSIPAMATGSPGAGSTSVPGMAGDDDYQKFCMNADKYLKEKFGDNLAKYMVSAAPPGESPMPDPTLPPDAGGEDDLVKMARQFASADKAVQVAQFQRLLHRLHAVESQTAEQAKQFSKDDAAQRVAMLVGEGFVMDPNEEQAEFERLPLGPEREKKSDKIRKFYQRDMFNAAPPVRGEFITSGPVNRINGNGKTPKQYSRQENDKIVAYASEHEMSYADARSKLYPDN